MMQVASLELSRTLYELSGWHETDYCWPTDYPEALGAPSEPSHYGGWHDDCPDYLPAYGAGYLLRKLPLKVKDEYQGDIFGVHLKQTGGTGWIVYYGEPGKSTEMYFNSGDTPENALCLLAVELWKQGVITK